MTHTKYNSFEEAPSPPSPTPPPSERERGKKELPPFSRSDGGDPSHASVWSGEQGRGEGAFAPFRRSQKLQRGQSIVVALLVLLLLAFVGGLFASIVTRNLRSAARSGRVENADFYAQAGLRFADDQLTHSTDGADWRPPLMFQLATNIPADAHGSARYNAIKATLPVIAAQDPDRAFLEQGFARYTIGQGRFLLRLTYSAGTVGTADPRARYIKIESVGRDGVIDDKDPTTYSNAPATRLNATLVEYKAIGITDYARFETNPDKRSDVMALGVASQYHPNTGNTDPTPQGIITPGVYDFTSPTVLPAYPIITEYGAADAYISTGGQVTLNPNVGSATPATNAVPGGGSIHANGTVRFYGLNHVYLNNTGQNSGALGETLEVGGDLLLDSYDPKTLLTGVQNAAVVLYPLQTGITPTAADYVTPSNDPGSPVATYPNGGFSTHAGLVRDAGTGTDAKGLPRNVARLEPPTLDSTDPVSNLTRYRALTQKSAPRAANDNGTGVFASGTVAYPVTDPGAGVDGYGQSIYVNNSSDIQAESSRVLGGATLVDEWLHRTEGRNNWTANFYRPPGVDIVLGRQTVNVPDPTGAAAPVRKAFYGVRLTRTDVDGAGQPVTWKKPDGTGSIGGTLTISYDDLYASNDPAANPATLTDPGGTGYPAKTAYQANPNNDVVIYAEGNVRVRGAASAADAGLATDAGAANDALPRHITIVTNGTAYIDGALVRGNPDSSISVLAHDYVCVNTTQFLAGAQVDENPAGTRPPDAYADPALRALNFSASDEVLLQEFSGAKANAAGQGPNLYVSGGPGASGSAQADFDVLDPRTGFSLVAPPGNNAPFTASPISTGAPTYSSTGAGTSTFSRTTYNFTGVTFGLSDSQFYQLAVRRTPVPTDPTATQDFLLERAAVLPMDVKIEATLFAQTRSFFVIPGEWFNTSSDDNMGDFVTHRAAGQPLRDQRTGTDASVLDAARYPFYGQPIDLKITVYGSVSEARPAAIDAQTAWMLHWGWIPHYHGSTFDPTLTPELAGHTAGTAAVPVPAIGLALVYNPLAAYPYNAGGGFYLRTDKYGRPLPSAPKLPVCAGLLYAGQSFDQPILQ